ncbi:MAG: DUF4286 family protein [Sediminibacterium sp.]
MFVYNISFQIDASIESAWLNWLKQHFIPSCLETTCFVNHQLYQLDLAADQPPTFTLQLFSHAATQLAEFQEKHAESLLFSVTEQWGEQCFHFNTSMRIVN